jgi:hypothetical protein
LCPDSAASPSGKRGIGNLKYWDWTSISSGWRTVVWTVALDTMGVACIVNALRCGRVHCYLTGPFFFLMALIALSYGLGMLHLGGNGWNLLGLMTLIGAIALWCLPEMLLGKYRERN